MNLERVQKYYELIDRELGLESNDDLFGFETDEEDLFGFESDEDDLFGFESDEEDLFGFESDEEDLFGTEGVKDFFVNAKNKTKGVIKKSFAFVMNILRTIVSAITTWWKNKKIKKLVSLLKKYFANKDAKPEDVQNLVNNLSKNDPSKKKEYVNFLKTLTSYTSRDAVENAQKLNDQIKSTKLDDMKSLVTAFSKCETVANTANLIKSDKYLLLNKTADDFDNLGRMLTLLMGNISYVSRKATQFFQRKGETWFMQEADKKILTSIKNLQSKSYELINGVNKMIDGLSELETPNTKEETSETAPESIMSDIKEMMAANESLNDIIFDMEMDI